MNQYLRALRVLPLLASVLLAGCAFFPQNRVAPVQLPVAAVTVKKPTAYANVQFFRGLPGPTARELPPTAVGMDKIHTMLRNNVSNSGLFSSVSYDSATRANADLQLNVRVYNHGVVKPGSMMAAILTGLTLYVIPSSATDDYTVQVDVKDKAGASLAQVSNEDSMRMWQGLVFLPMAGNSIGKGLEGTVGNQVRAALKAAYESGKLNAAYTQPAAPAVSAN